MLCTSRYTYGFYKVAAQSGDVITLTTLRTVCRYIYKCTSLIRASPCRKAYRIPVNFTSVH